MTLDQVIDKGQRDLRVGSDDLDPFADVFGRIEIPRTVYPERDLVRSRMTGW